MVRFCLALPVLCQFLGLLTLCSPVCEETSCLEKRLQRQTNPALFLGGCVTISELLNLLHLIFFICWMMMPCRPVWGLNEITHIKQQCRAWHGGLPSSIPVFLFTFTFAHIFPPTWTILPTFPHSANFQRPVTPYPNQQASSCCPSMHHLASQSSNCFLFLILFC